MARFHKRYILIIRTTPLAIDSCVLWFFNTCTFSIRKTHGTHEFNEIDHLIHAVLIVIFEWWQRSRYTLSYWLTGLFKNSGYINFFTRNLKTEQHKYMYISIIYISFAIHNIICVIKLRKTNRTTSFSARHSIGDRLIFKWR